MSIEYLFKHEVLVVATEGLSPWSPIGQWSWILMTYMRWPEPVVIQTPKWRLLATRGQAKQQKKNDCVDRALDARDGALPVHCNLESHPNCVVTKVTQHQNN